MFESFTLGGLTISALQAQIIGFLGSAFVVGLLLVSLSLVFAVRIARTTKSIAAPDVFAEYAAGQRANEMDYFRMKRRGKQHVRKAQYYANKRSGG
jgi:hypothetical protein